MATYALLALLRHDARAKIAKNNSGCAQTNVKGVHGKSTVDPPFILWNLRRLWYASYMVEKICDDKDGILVVDDEEMIEEMIEQMVERRGCLHASYNDPAEALQYYIENSQKITLMITDLTMPKLSGSDLIKAALQINPKLQIILLTGYAEEHIPVDVRPLTHAILPKPFVQADVIDVVRTALDKVDHQHLSS